MTDEGGGSDSLTGEARGPARRRSRLVWVGFFVLLGAVVFAAAGQLHAAPQQVVAATTERPSSTPTASPTPSPTVPTATPTSTPTWTPNPSPTATPTTTPTPTRTPRPTLTPLPTPTPFPTSVITEDVIHILLIGGDSNRVYDQNTDTLIVVVVNRETDQISMLSIPRDLWVYIPEYGYGRINTAQRIGYHLRYEPGQGPGLLMRTIEENLGIPIDHWVRVGYDGFARAVDELGGVDLLVPCRTNLQYRPLTSEEQQEIILEPGMHHLDGSTALRYVRTRRGDSDFERAQRQQRFLRAVWDQAKSFDIIFKVPALWSALQGAFQTDLGLGDVLALAPTALSLDPQRIRSLYIGRDQIEYFTTEEGANVLLPVPERIQEVVARLYAPPAEGVAAEKTSVRVLNGTGQPYLAHMAADQLRWAGFKVTGIGTAERVDYARTQITVYREQPEALTALARLLGVSVRNAIQQPDPDEEADILVILGADYDPCR